MLSKLGRSRRGVATIIAEVMMVLIVILLSAIVYVWVVPAFTSQASKDNAGAAYAEKFETVWAQFANYAVSSPETVTNCNVASSGLGCTAPNPFVSCNGSITSPTASNVQVPVNGVCVITAPSVGAVYVATGGNLTVIGATINGGLVANYSSSVTLTNAKVSGFTGLYNVQTVNISGSALNTSGNLGITTDGPGAAMYAGGRGYFSMTNTNVTGQVENEVGHNTIVNNNHITGRLEIESADLGQIINNVVGSLDLDANGTVVIAGNTVTGAAGCPAPPISGKSVCYGSNAWCGAGNNQIPPGQTLGNCIGNVEVDVRNTGSTPVTFVAVYMTNIPLAATLSWQLASGNPTQCGNVQSLTPCMQLPIVIPVGDMAEITMGWTAPSGAFPLPWNYIYFIFVSSHQNYVDGYLYFQKGLGMPLQSRLEQRICPPCY